jgi:hypothetical protein
LDLISTSAHTPSDYGEDTDVVAKHAIDEWLCELHRYVCCLQ